MASGTLFTYPENVRAYKILVAAQYSGASVSVVQDPPAFKLGETNKSAEFLKKFPLGKVPAFEGSDGTLLFESNAIAYYVANDQLRGTSQNDQALVQQFINLADNEIQPAAATWVFPTLGVMQYNKQNTERAKEDLKKILGYLNEYLKTRTFLVGERVTLADISVACNLLLLYKQVFDPEFRKPFGNVNRFFTTLINQPQFKSVIGEFKLAEKAAQFDAKKFGELTGGGKKKKDDKKEGKKQKQQQPKKEKPNEDEDDVPKPPPSKDPFADLPKSPFVMDEWKRMYSNNDIEKVALPYFWEKFDKEGYSLWYAEYKYPNELKRIFMSCNLISGMYQRLEKMKKYAFGNVLLFGQDNASTISGVWFWRGQELIFPLDENWTIDYESYSWKKLDPDTEETKKLVKEYFMHEGEFGGKELNQGKVFK